MNEKIVDSYYENILANIKKEVPQFNSNFDADEQYMVCFEFGQFMIQNYQSEIIFHQCINLINKALSLGSSITEEVIAMEVLSQLFDKPEIFLKVKEAFSVESNIVLDYYFYLFKKT